MIHLGDITKIDGAKIPPVDVITFGAPCQDLSIAGQRKGMKHSDKGDDETTRSGLFFEAIRIIKEMRERDRANVRSDAFIRPRFAVYENVPGAFSSNHGEDFRAVLEETIRIAEPEAPDIPLPPKGKWPLADAWYGDGWSVAYRVLDAQFWGVPQRRRRIALVADFGGQSAPEILFVRKGVCGDSETSGEAWKGATAGTGTGAYQASLVRMREGCAGGGKGPLIQNERSGTLGCNNDQVLFEYPPVARSLTARYDGSPCIDRGPNIVVAGFKYHQGSGAGNIGFQEETSPTLGTDHNPAVISFNTIVRRLTPLETERLQGYPDNYTDIGEWTDTKGKVHQTSDAARYKALGNSIALPPWKWVLKRLCACYERDATMASLFDGISGFVLIWTRLNGLGSVKWTSEIEEYPIAVCKRHFGDEITGEKGDYGEKFL